jgi:hypothetical protein
VDRNGPETRDFAATTLSNNPLHDADTDQSSTVVI